MTSTFVPYVAGSRKDRARTNAALALSAANPGVPVVYDERDAYQAEVNRQTSLVTYLTRQYPNLLFARQINGSVTQVTVTTPVDDVVAELDTETLVQAINAALDEVEAPAAPKARTRRSSAGRPKAGEKSISERFVDRLSAKPGLSLTLTSFPRGGKASDEELRKRVEARQSALGNFARKRGLKIKTRVKVSATAVALSARLVP